ncbi:MAG: hypothetical protein ACFB10_05835 [Salibacteraceae bacterium]
MKVKTFLLVFQIFTQSSGLIPINNPAFYGFAHKTKIVEKKSSQKFLLAASVALLESNICTLEENRHPMLQTAKQLSRSRAMGRMVGGAARRFSSGRRASSSVGRRSLLAQPRRKALAAPMQRLALAQPKQQLALPAPVQQLALPKPQKQKALPTPKQQKVLPAPVQQLALPKSKKQAALPAPQKLKALPALEEILPAKEKAPQASPFSEMLSGVMDGVFNLVFDGADGDTDPQQADFEKMGFLIEQIEKGDMTAEQIESLRESLGLK